MKLIFLVSLFSIATNVMGQESNAKSTEHGYSKFCTQDAAEKMNSLNQKTSDIVKDINSKKDEVNNLIAQKSIYSNLMNLKSDYYNSLKSISDTKDQKNKDIKNNVDNYRNLLRSSLTLSAVKYMFKKSSPDAKTMSDLCKNAEFKTTKLCDSYSSFFIHFTKESGILSKYLDSTIENLNANLSKVSNDAKPETISNAQKIFDTIPGDIDPEKIFEIISKNENLSNVLTIDNQNLIKNCLSEKELPNEKCNELIGRKDQILPLITAEMDDAQKKIVSERLSSILENDSNLKDNSRTDSREKFNEVKQSGKIESVLNGNQSIKDNLGKFGLSDEQVKDFESSCSKADQVANADVNKCNGYNKRIYDYIESKNNNLDSAIVAKQNELEKSVNDSNKNQVATYETLKKYIMDKFSRSCKNTKLTIQNSNLIELICANEKAKTNNSSGDNEVKSLKDKIDKVVERLLPSFSKSSNYDTNTTFSKEEINQYQSVCENTALKSEPEVKNICGLVSQDYQDMRNIMTEAEAYKYNHDNIVEVDTNPNNKYGYTAKPKKSWIRASGEAVAASIPQFYNTMMMNMNLQYQIQELENQALFQKQLMYMNDPNSPWMTTMPYFQTQFYSYGGGFDFQKYSNTKGFNFQN